MESIGEALPKEIARVQEIVAIYKTIPMGHIAAALMQHDINMAHKAMIEGDLPGMIAAYKSLKEWEAI
jgi:hypothetical protein